MHRRHFLGQLATGGIFGAAASAQPPAADTTPRPAEAPASKIPAAGPPAAAPSLTTTPLALMAPAEDGIDAVWGVSALSKGRLEWTGPDGQRGEAAADAFGMVPQGAKVLKVRLRGLHAGAEYRVRAVTTSAETGAVEHGAWKTFRTLDPQAKQTRFVIWNDTHINNPTIQQLHERTPAADFLVWNGDTCNDWTREELLIPTLLHPGERDITNGRPLMLVWGNHDVRGKWAYQLPDMIATPNGRPFYAFRSGPLAGICLHTGEDKPDDHPSFGGRVAFDSLRREQTRWLKDAISQPGICDAPFRIVFCHIPLRWKQETEPDYAKGGYDDYSRRSRDAWHELLVKWRTQLVVSGHTHDSAFIPADENFPYAQLVGGGPKPQHATWMDGRAEASGLSITVHALSGKVLHQLKFGPVA